MNFNQLQQLLTLNNGILSITGKQLASTNISELLTDFFTDAVLEITAATTVITADSKVLISGQTTLLNVKLPVTASFYLDNGIAQLVLMAQPAAGWSFATSFPALLGSTLGIARFSEVTWVLCSKAQAQAPAGFTFKATWICEPVIEELAWLIGQPSDTMSASGPLSIAFGLPQVDLRLGTAITTRLGNLALEMQLGFRAISYQGRTAFVPSTLVTTYMLDCTLSNGDGPSAVKVPVKAFFGDVPSLLTFRADTSQVLSISIEQLQHWIGGSAQDSQEMPSTLARTTFSIDMLEFQVSSEPKVIGIGLTLGVSGQWTVVPDLLAVKDLALNIYVSDPFDKRTFTNMISGKLDIDIAGDAPLVIDVAASFPHFTLQGALSDENDVQPPLAGLMAGSHGVAAPAGFSENLRIDSLTFFAAPSDSLYQLQVGVSGDWHLSDTVALRTLALVMLFDNSDMQVALETDFQIGDISLMLSADYDSDAGGWQLAGATGLDEKIHIATFLEDIDALFGVSTRLPETLEGLEISNVAVSLNTASLSFTLKLDVEMPWNGTRADATISIEYSKGQAGNYRINFSAAVELGGQVFALIFNEENDA